MPKTSQDEQEIKLIFTLLQNQRTSLFLHNVLVQIHQKRKKGS